MSKACSKGFLDVLKARFRDSYPCLKVGLRPCLGDSYICERPFKGIPVLFKGSVKGIHIV